MKEGVPHIICLFGPQGSGKGTQAERLSAWLGIPHISPGNIFRKAMADETDLGKQVADIINSGHLVPDEVTNTLMRERIEQEDCLMGFVFDGYPRNTAQNDALHAMTQLTHALVIDIPEEESLHRIGERRVCSQCGMTYHLTFKPSKVTGVCDVCGSALTHRDDDKPDAIRKRLDIYHTSTEPLITSFEQRGIVHRINGMGSIDDVWKRVQEAIQKE
ncbi:MAG: adenylate kinase [Candidatus Kerfeldbacteria bacterium]|nr:adenylate kinase [Candidatus Kerfeldbacteria bacterium]